LNRVRSSHSFGVQATVSLSKKNFTTTNPFSFALHVRFINLSLLAQDALGLFLLASILRLFPIPTKFFLVRKELGCSIRLGLLNRWWQGVRVSVNDLDGSKLIGLSSCSPLFNADLNNQHLHRSGMSIPYAIEDLSRAQQRIAEFIQLIFFKFWTRKE
jgi:hypothetical protein